MAGFECPDCVTARDGRTGALAGISGLGAQVQIFQNDVILSTLESHDRNIPVMLR
jgi:hypothetical protein